MTTAPDHFPAPLTPPDCDLRSYRCMMLDITRLRGSEFDATMDDAAWRAGFNLWMTAFHSVPAASLTDSEPTLCKAAGLGRDLKTWRKVKTVAMRGWVMCSDGLWYHLVLAEVALEAWLGRLAQQMSSGAGNAKRWGTPFDPEKVTAQIRTAAPMLAALAPESETLKKVSRHLSIGSPTGTENLSQQDGNEVPTGSQVKLNRIEERKTDSPPGEPVPEGLISDGQEKTGFKEFFEAFPKKEDPRDSEKAFAAALARGATSTEIVDGAARYAAHVKAIDQKIRWVNKARTWLEADGWRSVYQADAPAAPVSTLVDTPTDPSWGDRAAALSADIGEPNFRAYFADALVDFDCDPPRLAAANGTKMRLIAQKYPKQLRHLFGGEFALEVRA